MVEFAYNKIKNASTGDMPFELNCGYYPCVFYKKDVDPQLKSKSAEKLFPEL